MNTTVMSIAITEARSACKGEPDIVERVRQAMRACHDHWMVTDETQQLNSALAAAMLESNDDERERICQAGKSLNRLNNALAAMVKGVPVDLAALTDQMEAAPKADIPLMQLWKETSP